MKLARGMCEALGNGVRVVGAVRVAGGAGSLHLQYADGLPATQWTHFSDVALSSEPQFAFDLSQPLPINRFYRAWQTNEPSPALAATLATEIALTGAIGTKVRVDYINQFGPIELISLSASNHTCGITRNGLEKHLRLLTL